MQHSQSHTQVNLHSGMTTGRDDTSIALASTTAVSSSLLNLPLPPADRPSALAECVAGGVGGLALTLVAHPFDTLKVRVQSQPNHFPSGTVGLVRIIVNEGPRALFRGLSAPILTAPLVNAAVFATYEHGQSMIRSQNQDPVQPLTLLEYAAAGGYAGAVCSVIVCPVELVKTQLQLRITADTTKSNSKRTASTAKGQVRACVQEVMLHDGVKGLYRGFSATAIREVFGYSAQFWAYEGIKLAMHQSLHHRPPISSSAHLAPSSSTPLSQMQLLFAGGVAGLFAWLCSYPMDVVKTRLQGGTTSTTAQSLGSTASTAPQISTGFISCWKSIVRLDGYGVLWKGFGTCVPRAFFANAAGFLAYEETMRHVVTRFS